MDTKEPKTFEEQIEKIKSRGCIIGDDNFAINAIKQNQLLSSICILSSIQNIKR
ncbi:MAG: hypothetical protein NC110_07965 [Ruminococcus sp.]|nr:hypothetical protein [Ruminococcus sp.]